MGDSPSSATSRIVGRYAIFDEVASGGMATVFLGRLMGAGGFARTVAIKRLHPQFAKDPEFVAMFLDEARLAARIQHPNVVPTLDVVASKGELFLVMEYVRGEALSRLARAAKARDERVPTAVVLRTLSDALQGLHAAHEARDERGLSLQIVHRDVTPQNILVGTDGVARLLDFGVAKAAGRVHTTREGQIKGKLAYMAPEQLMGTGVSRQTDVYAASVVLWELLAGERLFAGGSETDVIAKLLRRDIRRPSEVAPGIPSSLDEVVMRGLHPKPEERYQTARDLCAALAGCGVPVAGPLAVGDWVEGLAEEALAQRAAKIAAIESESDTSVSAVGEPHGSTPPDSLQPPGTSRASLPTLAAPPPPALGVGSTEAPVADVTGVSVLSAALPSARARLLGAGSAAALLLGILVFALARGGGSHKDTSATSHAAPTMTAAAAPPAAVEAIVPPAPEPPVVASPPPPAPSAPAMATPPPAPTAATTATAPRRAAAPGARPAQPRPASKSANKDVFDSRD
jgi:serine/threonine-protein kinase